MNLMCCTKRHTFVMFRCANLCPRLIDVLEYGNKPATDAFLFSSHYALTTGVSSPTIRLLVTVLSISDYNGCQSQPPPPKQQGPCANG